MSNPFEVYIGKIVVFGAVDGRVTYEARLLALTPGWAKFEWPNSGGRIGWRNIAGYTIHKVQI